MGEGSLRTLDYHILRVCERLCLNEQDFLKLSYAAQLRLLAYDQMRTAEVSGWEQTEL